MNLNQVICFFYKKLLWKLKKKIREMISEEKMEKMKGRKEVNAELPIVE